MARRILTFSLFESNLEAWAGDWQKLPEWEFLEMLGFEALNTNSHTGTIIIQNRNTGDYFRLTSAGYVRTSAPQGYLFQCKKPNPIKELLRYVILRNSKKNIPQIPISVLESFFTRHPDRLEFLLELPKLREEIVQRTGITDSSDEINKRFGITDKTIKWLNKCSGSSWKINSNTGTIDIEGNFKCNKDPLGFRGIRFGRVAGDFLCRECNLTSLEGAPQEVGGSFDCTSNNLTSLEGAPQEVGESFDCPFNKLTSLKGGPQKVGKHFTCSGNPLIDLEGSPRKIGGYFMGKDINFRSFKGASLEIGGPFFTDQATIKTWSLENLLKEFEEGSDSLKSLLSPIFSEDALDSYFQENPTNLYMLDDFPDLKKGVLQRTGMKDLSLLGRLSRNNMI